MEAPTGIAGLGGPAPPVGIPTPVDPRAAEAFGRIEPGPWESEADRQARYDAIAIERQKENELRDQRRTGRDAFRSAFPDAPPPPRYETHDMVMWTNPITGQQESGSGSRLNYQNRLKEYLDANPAAQESYTQNVTSRGDGVVRGDGNYGTDDTLEKIILQNTLKGPRTGTDRLATLDPPRDSYTPVGPVRVQPMPTKNIATRLLDEKYMQMRASGLSPAAELEEARSRWAQQGEADDISDDEWQRAMQRLAESRLQTAQPWRLGQQRATPRDQAIGSLYSDLAREGRDRADEEYRRVHGGVDESRRIPEIGAPAAPPGPLQQPQGPEGFDPSQPLKPEPGPPSFSQPPRPEYGRGPQFGSYGSPGKGMRPQPYGGGFGGGLGGGFGGGFGGYQPSPYQTAPGASGYPPAMGGIMGGYRGSPGKANGGGYRGSPGKANGGIVSAYRQR